MPGKKSNLGWSYLSPLTYLRSVTINVDTPLIENVNSVTTVDLTGSNRGYNNKIVVVMSQQIYGDNVGPAYGSLLLYANVKQTFTVARPELSVWQQVGVIEDVSFRELIFTNLPALQYRFTFNNVGLNEGEPTSYSIFEAHTL